jgi:2-C-methyl-D-erythritol 2,4-cyclodiphosphate synthase
MLRIGHGCDAHQFASGRKLILGGVTIPYDKGMEGHSDGDVVIHAVCDALLGAAALGDMGQHFPDTSDKFKSIDSRILLRHVFALLQEKKFSINNIDTTILAQQPKLMSHIPQMRRNLAEDLHLDISQVSVKATTTDKMGFIGRGEGIAVEAVVLLEA